MKVYNKMAFFDITSGCVPKLDRQIADVPCFHCGRITRIPVKTEWIDWEIIAEEYRSMHEKTLVRFGQIVKDIDAMQPEHNPIRQYIHNQWMILLDELQSRYNQYPGE